MGMKLTGAFSLDNCKLHSSVPLPPAPIAHSFSTSANPDQSTPIFLFPHITGSYSSTTIVAQPSNGVATIMSNTIFYTSTLDFSGTASIEYEAIGAGGNSRAYANVVILGLS